MEHRKAMLAAGVVLAACSVAFGSARCHMVASITAAASTASRCRRMNLAVR